MRFLPLLLSAAFVVACSTSGVSTNLATAPGDDAGAPAVEPPDASAPDTGTTLTGVCASTFGSALTAGFGRLDGVVYAV